MRGILVVLAVAVTLSLVAARAPLLGADSKTIIPDEYIVVLHQNSTVAIRDFHVAELRTRMAESEKILNVFDIGTFIGYAARLTKDNLAKELSHPNVQYVETNQVVSINVEEKSITQTGATWGIDRIDQRTLPLDGTYSYWESAGAGVVAYVIDTGVLIAHTEFEGDRAKWGYNAVGDKIDNDGNGHGTHVAGTIGGKTYGVAKKVTIIAVKVLNSQGSGTLAGVVDGINWATKDHIARGKGALSVANMSLGGGVAATIDSATEQSVASGVIHAVAAGNNNGLSACNYSPARVESAITVGSSDIKDARSSFSNIGTCVDVFAPGTNILSAWIGASNTATNTISGTSMATPHVAGAVAVFLAHQVVAKGEFPSPTDVDLWIAATATKNALANPGTGSPNLLLFSPSSEISP